MTAPYKRILTIDFETRWDKSNYTLSKMTTEEYIRDARFKAFGACLHEYGTDRATQWYRGDELPRILGSYDWETTAVLAHNAQFDVSILSWVYGVEPAFIFDSLSMARALRGLEVGNSLMKLAEDFGLPPKGQAVHSTDGLQELDEAVERELAEYCKHDVYLCEQVFERLVEGYPAKELRLIDMTLKMYTRPLLELDRKVLITALQEEGERREGLLRQLGVEEAELASNPKFAALLETLGVTPPTKVSKTTGKESLALAKNDALFQALLNGEREDIVDLCEARLQVKSTGERTRAQRFLDISQRGRLPVPLNYYGAKSGRWTATRGAAINMQNLKRGGAMRRAILAPEGYELVVGDLSQIEPRVLAWLTDYEDVLAMFRSGQDVYSLFGANMFGLPGMTKNTHPVERQSAKSALLGAGYQLGWASFSAQLLTGFLGADPLRYTKADAKQLGVDRAYIERFLGWEDNVKRMADIPHNCTEQELLIHCVTAKKIIDNYRATAHPVTSFWDMCERLLKSALVGGEEFVYKCVTFKKEEIVLPSGMSIHYRNLRQDKTGAWVYDGEKNGRPAVLNLYGGKITNNIVQGTARVVMTDGMLRVSKKYPVVGTVHDELWAVVPAEEAEEATKWVWEQMVAEPKYMPGIPLNSEVGHSRCYGDVK
jgi:DNA polymerase